MFSALGLEISKRVERIVPDPFVIAIGLTLLTAIIALLWGDFGDKNNVVALLDSWRDGKSGMWKLLAFSMEMCLVLVTGYALATTNAVKSAIDSLADIPIPSAFRFSGSLSVIVNTPLGDWLVFTRFVIRIPTILSPSKYPMQP